MFKKILKFEIGFLKECFLVIPFLVALFVIIVFIEFKDYRNDWSYFKESFQENELKKLEAYKEDGYIFTSEQIMFRTTLIPSPYSSLFKGEYSKPFANVGIERIYIYEDARYRIFQSEIRGFNSIFLGLCIFVFMYGLSAKSSLADISQLSVLPGKNGKKKLFLFLFAARSAVITLFFLLIMIITVIFGVIFEIKIFGPLLIVYSFLAILVAILTFSIGEMFSFAHPLGKVVFPSLLLITIFIIIPIIDFDNIGNEDSDVKLNKILEEYDANIAFFEKTLEAEEKFKNKKIEPRQLEKFINEFSETYYNKIAELENRNIEEMKKKSRNIQIRDSFSPISFYISFCSELSNGKKNKISLYRKAKNLKKSYLTWNLKRRILGYNNVNADIKLEPFLKKDSDENIFYAAPSLPDGFIIGLFSTIFYIFIFTFLAYKYWLKNLIIEKDSEKPRLKSSL